MATIGHIYRHERLLKQEGIGSEWDEMGQPEMEVKMGGSSKILGTLSGEAAAKRPNVAAIG